MSHDPPSKDRRHFLTTSSVLGAAGVLWSALPFANAASLSPASNPGGSMTADLILHNGRFHRGPRQPHRHRRGDQGQQVPPSATTPRRCSIAAAPPR